MVLSEVRIMAEELTGERLILRRRGPLELFLLPRDIEGESLDPHVGPVNNPVYYTIYPLSNTTVAMGDCIIYNPQPGEVEFGIRIIAGFRDAGYGTEATKILSDYYLTTGGCSRVHLKVLPHNGRAVRAYEKAGFKPCGKIVVDGLEFIKMEKVR